MQIGDKVRFLNAVGGGKVTGFQGRDIVLVEDEDGFDVPVLIRNCVVVDSDQEKRLAGGNQTIAPTSKATEKPTAATKAPHSKTPLQEPEEIEPADRPVTFKPQVNERKGGDKLNIYLCFEPIEVKELSKTEFDIYLVNDSNYTVNFTFLSGENAIWMLRHIDTAEPNTKVYIETVNRQDLNELQHICTQMTFFKEERTFMLKAPVSAELRLDLTRFYKLHLFLPNEFFTTPVLSFPLLKNDELVGDPRKVLLAKTEVPEKKDTAQPHVQKIKRNAGNGDEVVDLHASELLDTTAGMNSGDILEYQLDVFRKKMQECSRIKGKRIVFIHGKGEGVLRNRIVTELKQKYPRCNWQDASFQEYGFGATLVIVH